MSFQNTCTRTITTDKEQTLCHCTLFVIFSIHKQKEMPFQNNVIRDLKQLLYRLKKKRKKDVYVEIVLIYRVYKIGSKNCCGIHIVNKASIHIYM